MASALSVAEQVKNLKVKHDDDLADRLSSRYTVMIFGACFFIAAARHFVTKNPIACWTPAHFTEYHDKYANSYCWVSNTFYLPWDEDIPMSQDREGVSHIPYYQWIPFILALQAALFYLPSVVWHGLNSSGGIDADSILECANMIHPSEPEEVRERRLKLVSNQLDRFLGSRRKRQKSSCSLSCIVGCTCCALCSRRMGNYLVMLYLFTKVLYILNVLGQLFLLDIILATDYHSFGIYIMKNWVATHDWAEAKKVAFPRVTLCDLKVRRLGNVHPYTVQCTLPINLYNEKIYIFLWYWMIFVGVVSIASLIVWSIRFLFNCDRLKFIINHLHYGKMTQQAKDTETCKRFVYEYLKPDGAFILRMIAHNTSQITTTEIICSLWNMWEEKQKEKETNKKFDGYMYSPVSTGDMTTAVIQGADDEVDYKSKERDNSSSCCC